MGSEMCIRDRRRSARRGARARASMSGPVQLARSALLEAKISSELPSEVHASSRATACTAMCFDARGRDTEIMNCILGVNPHRASVAVEPRSSSRATRRVRLCWHHLFVQLGALVLRARIATLFASTFSTAAVLVIRAGLVTEAFLSCLGFVA